MSRKIVADGAALRLLALTGSLSLLRRAARSAEQPVLTSRLVVDPDFTEGETALPELTESIRYQRRLADDISRPATLRAQAHDHVDRLETVVSMCDEGLLLVVDMDDEELSLFASMSSASSCQDYGLPFPLCPSSASCVAIAAVRETGLLTDDADARTAAHRLGVARALLALDDLEP